MRGNSIGGRTTAGSLGAGEMRDISDGGVHPERPSERTANVLRASVLNFLSARCSILLDNLIDDAVGECFVCAHEVVTIGVFVDFFKRLARVSDKDVVESAF